MKNAASILRLSMELAERMGNIHDAHMYDSNFISVDGETSEGKKFSITVRIEEEKEND